MVYGLRSFVVHVLCGCFVRLVCEVLVTAMRYGYIYWDSVVVVGGAASRLADGSVSSSGLPPGDWLQAAVGVDARSVLEASF